MSLIEQSKIQGVSKKCGAELRRFAAPYIPDIMPSFDHGHVSANTIFYRTSDPYFSRAPKDLLAVGHFNEYSCTWAEVAGGTGFEPAAGRLSDLLKSDTIMAGYISYEFGYAFEKRWQQLKLPETGYAWRFLEIDCWYEADHHTRSGAVYALDCCPDEQLQLLQSVVAECLMDESKGTTPKSETKLLGLDQIADLGELKRSHYSNSINRILEDITAGRFYELNFTQRFSLYSGKSPKDVYQKLFADYNPQRGFYCKFGNETIGSCSPELFLIKEGPNVYTRPIKGSFKGALNDNQLEKLSAEHVMVVDLARNDIGRISDLGWVQVPELNAKSSFGGLNHIESLVAGKTSLSLPEILKGTFPAASITGAPKVEVVSAISEFENSFRGVYTGTCGWKWGSGDVDLNVAIRTFVASKHGNNWHYVTAGGGAIVADSIPDREYEECLLKVQPLLSELLGNE